MKCQRRFGRIPRVSSWVRNDGIYLFASEITNKGLLSFGSQNQSSFNTGIALNNEGTVLNDTCGVIDVVSQDIIRSVPVAPPVYKFENHILFLASRLR